MATFTTGDTAPDLTGTANADLTGASAVVHLVKPDGTIVTGAATLTDAANGAWSYTWAAGDLSVAGVWTVELQVTYADSSVQTFGPERFYVGAEIA